MKVWFNKLFNR